MTGYALSFGNLLLSCGRLADLIGRKVTFLAGFAAASAAGGASDSFTMLVTARTCQGIFAALLTPSALSLLTTTFTDPKERGKAFGGYGAAGGRGPRAAAWRRTGHRLRRCARRLPGHQGPLGPGRLV